MPTVLHVGCGPDPLPAWLSDHDEVRLDINPDVQPDIVASMTALGDIGPFDALYCSHALEHLYPHEVGVALTEFRRVLAPGGLALVFVPDLQDVQPTDDPLFVSAAGPISGRDMYYGFAPFLKSNPHMAHKTGFVKATLERAFTDAGFAKAEVVRFPDYNLFAAGVNA